MTSTLVSGHRDRSVPHDSDVPGHRCVPSSHVRPDTRSSPVSSRPAVPVDPTSTTVLAPGRLQRFHTRQWPHRRERRTSSPTDTRPVHGGRVGVPDTCPNVPETPGPLPTERRQKHGPRRCGSVVRGHPCHPSGSNKTSVRRSLPGCLLWDRTPSVD